MVILREYSKATFHFYFVYCCDFRSVCCCSNQYVVSSPVPLVSVAAASECFLSTAVVSSFLIATYVLRNCKHLPQKLRFQKREQQRFGTPIPTHLFGNRAFDDLVMWFQLLSPVITERSESPVSLKYYKHKSLITSDSM